MLLGRASLIIFILALTIFVSAISLGINIISQSLKGLYFRISGFWSEHVNGAVAGGVGIANMVEKLERKEHMGFENLCYHPQTLSLRVVVQFSGNQLFQTLLFLLMQIIYDQRDAQKILQKNSSWRFSFAEMAAGNVARSFILSSRNQKIFMYKAKF